MKKYETNGVLSMTVVLAFALGACNGESQNLTTTGSGSLTEPTTEPPATPTDTPTPVPTSEPTSPVSGRFEGPDEVIPYVQKFVDDAAAQGMDVLGELDSPKLKVQIAKLDHLGSGVIGLCETSGSLRRVTFDPDFWDTVSETQKMLLAHHELGHCMLYRGHRTATLSSGAYASIMYPLIMSTSTFNGNSAHYLNELFTYAVSATEADPNASTIHVCDQDELLGLEADHSD